jgi:serine protease Do
MDSGKNFFISLGAGLIGGILVLLVAANNPNVSNFFGSAETDVDVAGHTEEKVEEKKEDQSIGSIQDYESALIETVEKTNPAVVSIVVTKDVPIIERFYEESPSSPLDLFDNFFNSPFGSNSLGPFQFQVPQYRQNGTEKREVGGGSGFIISADGMVITNRHVVSEDDVEYTVLTNDGSKYDAQVLARDPVYDLAVLKIEGSDLPYLEFGDSSQLKVGQTVIVIGNALAEFRNTVSVGVVSGLSRSIVAGNNAGQSEQLDEVIQTDAAINPGNSGGPLVNLQGQVVGVNVAVALNSENIGFSLPSNLAKVVVDSVKESGKIVRPYLGVRYVAITPAIKNNNNLSVDYGALVLRGENIEDLAVVPGSPADKAGIEENDIVLEIDGVKLQDGKTLAGEIRKKGVGQSITVKLLHKGEEKEVGVVLEEMPEQESE